MIRPPPRRSPPTPACPAARSRRRRERVRLPSDVSVRLAHLRQTIRPSASTAGRDRRRGAVAPHLSRVEQLLRIGRGETTQAEINETVTETGRRRYTPSPRQEPPTDAVPQEPVKPPSGRGLDSQRPSPEEKKARKREKDRRYKARLRAARVAAGAPIPKQPLAPIEHPRLTKAAHGARLSYDFSRHRGEKEPLGEGAALSAAARVGSGAR